MPIYRAPLSEFRFVLEDFLDVDRFADMAGYTDLTSDLRTVILEGAAKLCEERLLPLNRSGDIEGCRIENGQVYTPAGFKAAYREYVEGGWPALSFDPEFGGQGLPSLMSIAVSEMVISANMGLSGYFDITHGACALLAEHGSREQQRQYLPNLVAGRWSGAMHLTEPHAGSDISMVRARAELMPDGTYRLYGSKIFITGVDHDLTENIINLVLARIPGSPPGSKGISLFIVPKFLVKADGSLGERNAVYVGGIEHKMGVHSSATCAVNFEGAVGHIIGEPNQGLRQMFTMMNDTRLGVGVQGLGISEVAYQNALAYARERLQGRSPSGPKHPDQPADPIVVHPDVRRMLLTMKSFNEAARAFALWTALQIDISRHHADASERQRAADLVALLTPVIKAHFTDCGSENANLALQCFGGHGYVCEWGVEQFVRDVRIGQIYEGTNGIQCLDLAARKLNAHGGRLVELFFAMLDQRVLEANAAGGLTDYASGLQTCVTLLRQTTAWMRAQGERDMEVVAAGAGDYLRLFAIVALTWVWTGMAVVARRRSESGGDAQYYGDKLATGRFYLARTLPEASMLAARARSGAAELFAVKL